MSPQRLMFNKNIVLVKDSLIKADLAVVDSTWEAGFSIVPSLKVSRLSDKDKDTATVNMTIKDDCGNLLYKKKFAMSKNNVIKDSIVISDKNIAEKFSNHNVQVSFSILNELEGCAEAQIKIYRDSIIYKLNENVKEKSGTKSVRITSIPASVYSSYNRFDYGPLYRGWGQFAWNGNSSNRLDPIEVSEMKAPENNGYINDDGSVNKEAMKNGSLDINEQKFFTMSYLEEYGKYFSSTDSAYIDSVVIRPSRLGADAIVIDSIQYCLDGTGLSAPVQKLESNSESESYSGKISVGASIGANKSTTSQKSFNIVSLMDINGDGYPDWLNRDDNKTLIQLTTPVGSLSEEKLEYDIEGNLILSEAKDNGIELAFSTDLKSYNQGYTSQLA